MKNLIFILFGSMLVISCDKNKVYEDISNFKNAYWLADSLKYFEFSIDNDTIEYDLNFSLRNGREYPHSNIYIEYAILDSASNVIDEELRNFQLFNQKTGFPLGNGSGNIYEHQFELLEGYQFPGPGHYRVRLQQYMRYDSLPEIYSVGISVERKLD